MSDQDLVGLTVYQDLVTVLQEKGYSDAQITEIVMKLTSQAEMEVTEAVIAKLTDQQLKDLDELPDDASAYDVAKKLNLDGDEIEAIRAEKLAELISQMVEELNK